MHDRLLQLLGEERTSLFAILDAARDPRVLALLRDAKQEYQSLYEGVEGQMLADYAPYLVNVAAPSPLLRALATQGWGKSWGVFLTCPLSLQEVRKHLRRFLMVKTEDGKEVYFRFYDPRVLRVFLPTCTAQESKQFFGPISSFLVEAKGAQTLLKFVFHEEGTREQALALSN